MAGSDMVPQMRLPDWRLRLDALIAQRRDLPFQWGLRDCCLWAADVVVSVTGRDPMADYRGRYETEREALRLLRSVGVENLAEKRVGFQVAPWRAWPGDVGVVYEAKMPALVARVGGCWMAQGPKGLVVVNPAAVRMAWRPH